MFPRETYYLIYAIVCGGITTTISSYAALLLVHSGQQADLRHYICVAIAFSFAPFHVFFMNVYESAKDGLFLAFRGRNMIYVAMNCFVFTICSVIQCHAMLYWMSIEQPLNLSDVNNYVEYLYNNTMRDYEKRMAALNN